VLVNGYFALVDLVGFNSLFQASGKDMQDTGNGLDREDYCSGNTLYAFNIEVPEFEGLDYLTLLKQAIVRIESHVNNPIPEPCICVVERQSNVFWSYLLYPCLLRNQKVALKFVKVFHLSHIHR
jgi:hypothetical protein